MVTTTQTVSDREDDKTINKQIIGREAVSFICFHIYNCTILGSDFNFGPCTQIKAGKLIENVQAVLVIPSTAFQKWKLGCNKK